MLAARTPSVEWRSSRAVAGAHPRGADVNFAHSQVSPSRHSPSSWAINILIRLHRLFHLVVRPVLSEVRPSVPGIVSAVRCFALRADFCGTVVHVDTHRDPRDVAVSRCFHTGTADARHLPQCLKDGYPVAALWNKFRELWFARLQAGLVERVVQVTTTREQRTTPMHESNAISVCVVCVLHTEVTCPFERSSTPMAMASFGGGAGGLRADVALSECGVPPFR